MALVGIYDIWYRRGFKRAHIFSTYRQLFPQGLHRSARKSRCVGIDVRPALLELYFTPTYLHPLDRRHRDFRLSHFRARDSNNSGGVAAGCPARNTHADTRDTGQSNASHTSEHAASRAISADMRRSVLLESTCSDAAHTLTQTLSADYNQTLGTPSRRGTQKSKRRPHATTWQPSPDHPPVTAHTA